MGQFLYALVPQLIRSKLFNEASPLAVVHRTSWLNGLRGLAALTIFNLHYLYFFTNVWERYSDDITYWRFLKLPIIRLFYSGEVAVHIFFLVAGFSNSYKALQRMSCPDDVEERTKLYSSLSTTIFTRFFRLYLPVLAIGVFTLVAAYLSCYDFIRRCVEEDGDNYFPGPSSFTDPPWRAHSFTEQSIFWAQETWKLMCVWNIRNFFPQHDGHLWTINLEFRASLCLYLILVAVAPARMHVRSLILVVVSLYAMAWDRWEVQLYVAGACLAQFDACIQRHQATQSEAQNKKGAAESESFLGQDSSILIGPGRLAYTFRPILIILRAGAVTTSLIGLSTSYVISAAITLMACLITTPTTSYPQKVLNSQPAQYLGKISYSFYLIHGPVMFLGPYLFPQFMWAAMGYRFPANTCGMGSLAFAVGVSVGWVLNLVVVLWVADIFTREVEERTKRFTFWIRGICFNNW